MIDKVWYDWQNKSPRNKYSYGGGSVTPLPHYTTYETFPTGLPPYLNVSASSQTNMRDYCVSCASFASQFDSQMPSDNLWDANVTVWDVMDTTGGKLCYVYA